MNVFENQKNFLKSGCINIDGFIKQENVYKLDSWPLQKKYHPISTNPKIGVQGGGKLLRIHGNIFLILPLGFLFTYFLFWELYLFNLTWQLIQVKWTLFGFSFFFIKWNLNISVFWGPGPAPMGPWPQLKSLAPAPTGPRPRLIFLAPAPAGPWPQLRFLAPAPTGAVAPFYKM